MSFSVNKVFFRSIKLKLFLTGSIKLTDVLTLLSREQVELILCHLWANKNSKVDCVYYINQSLNNLIKSKVSSLIERRCKTLKGGVSASSIYSMLSSQMRKFFIKERVYRVIDDVACLIEGHHVHKNSWGHLVHCYDASCPNKKRIKKEMLMLPNHYWLAKNGE